MSKIGDLYCENTTNVPMSKRLGRAAWLLTGIDIIAGAITDGSPELPGEYEAASAIRAISWAASAEICAIQERVVIEK